MYVCGLTVYDFVHIGHARMLLVFDVISRYLRHRGYQLTYVRNITDIDDKIIQRAAALREPIEAFTERFISAMREDCAQLGILPPDHEPRATQFVPQIIAMVAAAHRTRLRLRRQQRRCHVRGRPLRRLRQALRQAPGGPAQRRTRRRR